MPAGGSRRSPLSPTLSTLNEDVFRLIVDQLHREGGSLRNLALSSHTLRDLCIPILFSRCEVDVRKPETGDPPKRVCVHVRHLTHLGPLGKEQDVEYFETLLDLLPLLRSVAIKDTSGHIPWGVWKACVSRPRIKFLSYDAGIRNLDIPPFPSDEVQCISIALQRFSYTTTMWREWFNVTKVARNIGPRPIDMRPVFEFERECLSAVVLKMNETAVSLTLPLESTPVLAMAELSWPNLKELNLHGRLLDAVQVTHFERLLPSLPSLVRLSILAARTPEVGRPPFIPSSAPPSPGETRPRAAFHVHRPRLNITPSSPSLSSSSLKTLASYQASLPPRIRESLPGSPLFELRALEVAFPNPMDGIFSIPMPLLSHLSLRDHPRMYHQYTRGRLIGDGPMKRPWYAPILLDYEILFILRRIEPPFLTSLEIVYEITEEYSDSELLSYIVDTFSYLQHLEVHRYRPRWNIPTQHKSIVKILSRAQSLRTIRLNLDFRDGGQAYCGDEEIRDRWLQTLRTERGPEIVEIMQGCPFLEYVAILYHGKPSSVWVEFHPSRCAGPRFVMSYSDAHVDSEMVIRRWDAFF